MHAWEQHRAHLEGLIHPRFLWGGSVAMATPSTDLVVPGQAVGAQATASGISTLHVEAVEVKAAERSGGVIDDSWGAGPGPGRVRQLACVSKVSGANLEGQTYPQCLSGSRGAQKLSAWSHRPPGEDGSHLYHERARIHCH